MAKRTKSVKGKIGIKYALPTGKTYALISHGNENGQEIFIYKWYECPDANHVFKSTRELDSIDITHKIIEYEVDMRGVKNE